MRYREQEAYTSHMQSPTKLTYISRKRSKENDISKSPICFTKLSNTPKKQLPHSQSHSKLKRSVDTSPKTVREHHTRVLTMPNFASTDRIQKSEIVTPRGDSRGTSSRNKPAQGTKIPSASKSILKTPNKEVKAANERSKQPQNLREHILYLIMELEKSQAISLEHEYEIKSLKSELEASMKESNQKLGMLVKMLKNQLNDLDLIEKKEQTINEIYQRRVADIDGVVKLLEADGNTPMKSEEKQISNDSANLAHEKLQREMVLLKAERDKYKSMLDVMAIELEFHSKHCQFAIGQEDSVKKKSNSKFSIEIGHHSEKKSVQEKKVSPMKLALGKVLKRLENIGTISKGSDDDYLENESSSRRSRQSPESTSRLATGRSLIKQHHSLRLNETANNLSDRWANLSLSDRQAKEVHWGSLQHSMQRDASLSANYPFERQCFTNASNKHTVKLNTEILLKKISENVELHDQSDTPNHKREEFVDEKNNIGYERLGFQAETTEIKLGSFVKQDNDNDDKVLETTTKNVSDLDIRFETALNTEEMRDNTSLPQNQHALNSNQDKPQHQELEELNQSGKNLEQQQVEQLQSKLIEETDNGFEFKLIVETQMPDSTKEQVPSSELKAKKRRGETEKRASIQDFNNSGQQVEVTEENAGKRDQSEQNIISRDTNLEIENKARAQGHGQEISPTDALALGVEPTISEVIEEIFIHSNGNSPTKQEFEKEDTREPSVFNYSTGKVEPSSNKYENNTDNRENHEANVFICKAHNNPSCFSCAMDLAHVSREISKLQSEENEYTSQLENLKLEFIKEAREKANAIRSLEEENTTLKKLTDTVQQPTSYSTMFELQAELDRVRGQLDELKYFLLPSRANEADDLSHQGSITHIYGTPAEVGTPKSLSHHEEDAPNEPNQDLEYSQVLEVEKVADFPEKTTIPQRIQNLNLQSHPTFQPVSQFEWFSQTINTVSNKHDWEISEKLNKFKDARVEEIKERLIPLIQKLKKEELLQELGFICGIDCTVSNVFTGRKSFGNRHLHEISTHQLNFYEKALSTVGAVATNFSHEGKLSVYLFGDDQTRDKNVRTLYADEVGNEECYGIDHALAEYRRSIAKIFFSGPTSFRPLIDKAIEIAQRKKEFQLLMIIGDGAVTNVQENVNAIAEASNFPIAIMMVGVGDGDYNQYPKDPWQGMKELVNLLPPRRFENIRFLRYEDEMPLEEFAESVFEYVIKAYQFCAESKMIETLDKATSRGEEPGRSVCIPVNEISDSPTIQSQKGGAFHSGGNLKEEDGIQSSNAQESNVVISQIYRENNSSENSSQIELETGDRGHVKVKKVVKKKVSKKLSSPKTEVQKEEVSSSNKSSVVEEPAETEKKVNVVGKKVVKKVVKKKKTGNSIEETTTQQVETGNEHKMSIKAEGGVSDNLGNRKSIKKTTKKKADPVSESIENDPKIQSSESLLKEPEVSVLEESKEESRPEHIKPKTVKKFVKKKVTESSLQPSETPLAHTDMKESKDNSLISPKITSIEHVGKTEALPSKSNPSEPSSKEILKTKAEEGSIIPSEREPNDLKVKKVVKKVVKKK